MDKQTTEVLKFRKIASQNIVNRLIKREIFGSVKPGTQTYVTRSFYQNIFPSFAIVNVDKPPCFLRKFSPTGQYFIAFSADQTSIEVYFFQGCCAANDIVYNLKGELVGHKNDAASNAVRNSVFDRFFKLKYTVNVAPTGEQLNRECSLFTEDGRFVIVGSASYIPEELRPSFYEIYTNNECVTPNPRSLLEDYTLHIVDLYNGKLCDSKQFKVDKIYLSHNQGVYLYKDTLAVLSVQHQTIHLFQVVDGIFINVRSIGRFCYDDDDFILSSVYPHMASSTRVVQPFRPFTETCINSLKHKLLVFLYRLAHRNSELVGHPLPLRNFFRYFDQYRNMRIWKMQLLDENHILVKYTSEDIATLKATSNEPNAQPAIFMIYNIVNAEVLAVYENWSDELLYLYENFCDHFRNTWMWSPGAQYMSTPSNSIYARLSQQRYKATIISARFGGRTEATKRILGGLPISAQSYSTSPYLDLALFSYDDKLISALERPRTCGEHPIRFYGRDSGLLKFRIYAGVHGQSVPQTARRLVAFTFHPTEPFAISVQRINSEYVVNFHIRHPNCDALTSKAHQL